MALTDPPSGAVSSPQACPGSAPGAASRPSNRFSRRSLFRAAGVGAVASVLPLSACSGSSGAGGSTTIRFEERKFEVVPYFDKLVQDFNGKQSAVQVTHDSTSDLIAQFVRGNAPDIDCDNYNLTTSLFIARGVLANVADLPEAKTIDPNIQALVAQYAQYNNETSVLPYSVAAEGVVYNTEIFDKYSVKVPMTWTELIAACELFKSKGLTPIYGTLKDPWTIAQGLFDYIVGGALDVAGFFSKLKALGPNAGKNGDVSFSEDFKPAAAKMLQLAKYMNPDAASRGYADGNSAFAAGQGAMYLQGPWAVGEILKANPKAKVSTFALPATDNPADTKCRVNLDLAIWLPRNGAKHDAAVTFLTYLMQPAVMNKYNADNLAFSPLKDAPAVTNPAISGLEPYIKAGKFYQGAGTYFPNVIPYGNYLQAMVLNKDANTALAQMDNDWNRVAKRSV